jgi:hypothetical protein
VLPTKIQATGGVSVGVDDANKKYTTHHMHHYSIITIILFISKIKKISG